MVAEPAAEVRSRGAEPLLPEAGVAPLGGRQPVVDLSQPRLGLGLGLGERTAQRLAVDLVAPARGEGGEPDRKGIFGNGDPRTQETLRLGGANVVADPREGRAPTPRRGPSPRTGSAPRPPREQSTGRGAERHTAVSPRGPEAR